MKHCYFFLIITSLLLTGCGQKDRAKSQFESSVQTEESELNLYIYQNGSWLFECK